jgi:carbon monoxide dehydrogenase subunit G
MKIIKELTVNGSRESVFELFQDIPSVAQCLPGAQITAGAGQGPFQGTVAVSVGPVSASFEGEATFSSDASTFSGEINGLGTDLRGGNRGDLTLRYRLEPAGAATTTVLTDVSVELSGPIARFGRTGLLNEIADQIIGEFSACLDTKSAAESVEAAQEVSAASEIKGIRLVFSSLIGWLKRLFGRQAG